MEPGRTIELTWPAAATMDERWQASSELLEAVERRVADAPEFGWVAGAGAQHDGGPRALNTGSYRHFHRPEGPYRRDVVVAANFATTIAGLNMAPAIATPAINEFFERFVKPVLIAAGTAHVVDEALTYLGPAPRLQPAVSSDRLRESLRLPAARVETCTVDDGIGAIALKGGFESVLYFRGIPQVINWPDCQGSIGQQFVRTGQGHMTEDLASIRSTVRSRLPIDQPMATQVAGLLRLFEPGPYTLTNEDRTHIDAVIYGSPDELEGYYPDGDPFFFETRPPDEFDEATISTYEDQIARGERPLVITASVGVDQFCEFVIDGHHKLRAYLRNQTPPNVLNVHRDDSSLGLEEGLAALGRSPGLQTYRKVKTKYGMH